MKAYLLSLNPDASIADQWDFGMLKDILAKLRLDNEMVTALPNDDAAVVVLPARHHKGMETVVNAQLNKIGNVVLFLMGDEEADFDVELIKHPSIHIWVQNPHPGKHDNYYRLGTGYPQHMHESLPEQKPDKTNNVFFSGQVTHQRRKQMQVALDSYSETHSRVVRNYTESFTSGLEPKNYYKQMCMAKVALCPSGAVIPDSFRLFEALECMAVPIADEVNPDGSITEYWDWLFAETTPIPKITNWDRIFGLIPELIKEQWPANMHQITAWWIMYKRNLTHKIKEQLYG